MASGIGKVLSMFCVRNLAIKTMLALQSCCISSAIRMSHLIVLSGLLFLLSTNGVFQAHGQEPEVVEFQNGVLSWSNSASTGFHSIEWACSLTSQWSRTWRPLQDMRAVGGEYTVEVPLFYRVLWHPTASATSGIPPDVISFSATAQDGFVGLIWNNPASGNFSGVQIMRKTGWYPEDPSDGVQIYKGLGTARSDFSVVNGTRYYYTAFGYNADNEYSFGVIATALPSDNVPPGDVSGFTATPGDRQAFLRWSNPVDADFAGVRVVRSTAGPPAGPTSGTIVYSGPGTNATDSGLANNVLHYYKAFAFDFVPNYSGGRSASAMPENTDPPPNISNLSITIGDERLIFNWANPSSGDFLGVRVQRATGSAPANPFDGDTVYEAGGRSFTNINLVNGTEYFYSFFTYDEVPNYASGVVTSGIPRDFIPPGNASNFTASPIPGNIRLQWNPPGDGDLAGFRVIRKTTGYPSAVDDGTLVYMGVETNATDAPLPDGFTTNYYRLFCFDEVTNHSSGVNAIFSPPTNVTWLRATNGDECVILAWTNPPSSTFAGVRIQRKNGSAPTNAFDGLTVYEGTDRGFTNAPIPNFVDYHYGFFSFDATPNYSSGRFTNAMPVDVLAPGRVTNLVALSSNQYAVLRWTNPTDDDLAGVRIQRREDRVPTNFADGVTVFDDLGAEYIDTSLVNGSNYYYSAFAHDEVPNYAARMSTNCIPLRTLWIEDFETGWVDYTNTYWSHAAPSGVWSSRYVQAFSDASFARSGNRFLKQGDSSSFIYLPPAENPRQLNIWARTPAGGVAYLYLRAFVIDSWYDLEYKMVSGSVYSNYTYDINISSLEPIKFVLLLGSDMFIDDIEMRVAP